MGACQRKRPIGLEPLRLGPDVLVGQVGIEGKIYPDLGKLFRLGLCSPQLADGIGDELHIEVEADGRDVACLHLAEHAAGAADLEVAHGQLEPGAEVGELADRLEPPVGLLAEPLLLGMEEVGIGPLAGAPDASPQLVELGEPEQVGALDDERVHGGQVEPRFDDRGGDEHVVLPVPEVEHHLFQLAFAHPTVGDRNPRIGHQAPQPLDGEVDRLDPVVHVEDLALAQHLSSDRRRDRALVEGSHVRENRMPVLGRGADVADLTYAGQRHLQGPGYRRGRQRQDVDRCPQLFEAVLGGDTETLLLVDDEQSEVPEIDVLRQQAMGADDDVHRARGHP